MVVFGGGNLQVNRNEKNAEHNEQLGTLTLGFVFASGAHMWRFMNPETKHQSLFDHSIRGTWRRAPRMGFSEFEDSTQ